MTERPGAAALGEAADPIREADEADARADDGQARGPSGAPARPRGRRVLRRTLLGLGLVVLLVVSYLVGTFLQVWRASTQDGARPAEAIVVLGAAQYNGRPSPVLRNRLDHALALYEDGVAPMVVVTGGRQEGDRFTEAGVGYNYLRERGVPDEALRLEVQGHTTYESVAAVARFLRTEDIDDVVLISGPAQNKRLAGIADDVGLHAAISASDGSASARSLVRESLAVSVGRIIGYRRLERLDR